MSMHKSCCLSTLKELEVELKKLIGLGWKILSVFQTSTGYIVTAEIQEEKRSFISESP